jgi:adsorption protein B
MEDAQALLAVLDLAWREIALFASVGFLLLGTSELAIDLIWLLRPRSPRPTLADLPPSERPGRIAVFVPAWDEAAVIADMLRHTLERWSSGDFVLYVGCYPNDPATIAAVRSVEDHRIRLVIGPAGIM